MERIEKANAALSWSGYAHVDLVSLGKRIGRIFPPRKSK
jgi:hypothetical protein